MYCSMKNKFKFHRLEYINYKSSFLPHLPIVPSRSPPEKYEKSRNSVKQMLLSANMGVQTITTITTTTAVLVAEAPGKTNFPTMLSGGVQGQEKRRPKHKCCGKKYPGAGATISDFRYVFFSLISVIFE